MHTSDKAWKQVWFQNFEWMGPDLKIRSRALGAQGPILQPQNFTLLNNAGDQSGEGVLGLETPPPTSASVTRKHD